MRPICLVAKSSRRNNDETYTKLPHFLLQMLCHALFRIEFYFFSLFFCTATIASFSNRVYKRKASLAWIGLSPEDFEFVFAGCKHFCVS
mmetsp:Transcript_36673/g.36950  ORF Transcript_36673/g.36950 Transcript_36673/m.36950 type:complete len:89 (+) Transcript_36673:161-427(+)